MGMGGGGSGGGGSQPSEEEASDANQRNRAISSSAINRALQDANAGMYLPMYIPYSANFSWVKIFMDFVILKNNTRFIWFTHQYLQNHEKFTLYSTYGLEWNTVNLQ